MSDSEEEDDALLCPVCLDLLYEPVVAEPCGHEFCEPCLRKMVAKSAPAVRSRCPKCRQNIAYCERDEEKYQTIKSRHPSEFIRRMIEELSAIDAGYLPWNPGWKEFSRDWFLLPRRLMWRRITGIVIALPSFVVGAATITLKIAAVIAFLTIALPGYLVWEVLTRLWSKLVLRQRD